MKNLGFKAKSTCFFLVLFFLLLLSAEHVFAEESYNLIDLNTMHYATPYATSINNNGVVAGYIEDDGVPMEAFKWIDGQGFNYVRSERLGTSMANSINDKDEIAGVLFDFLDYRSAPYVWHDCGVHIIFYPFARAKAINNNAQIIINVNDGFPYPLFWENNKETRIASCGEAIAINDLGQVIGWCDDGNGEGIPFLWENNVLTDLNDLITGASECYLTYAVDINNSGQIVGRMLPSPNAASYSSFLFDNGNVTDLGFHGARAINDNGQIVGSHYIYQNEQVYDLNDLIESDISFSDLEVRDINNSGQIIGSATIDGSEHAVFLNPTVGKKSFGYEEVFSYTSTSKRRTAMPFTMPEDGSSVSP